jgi:hypothetical protein
MRASRGQGQKIEIRERRSHKRGHVGVDLEPEVR